MRKRYEDKKEKFKKPTWILRWRGLRKSAPSKFSEGGQWEYMDRKKALLDKAIMQDSYTDVDGPFVKTENRRQRNYDLGED